MRLVVDVVEFVAPPVLVAGAMAVVLALAL